MGGDLTLDAGNAIKVSGTDMSVGRDMGFTGKDVETDQFQYGVKGYAEDTASRVANIAKAARRGPVNFAYLIATHGPYGNVQDPTNLFDDSNGPKPGGGLATTLLVPSAMQCLPSMPVSLRIITPPLGASIGSSAYKPSNAVFSDSDCDGWNGNSAVKSEPNSASAPRGVNSSINTRPINGDQTPNINSAPATSAINRAELPEELAKEAKTPREIAENPTSV